MERTELFELMGALKLFGMKAAFDEVMPTAVKRQHEPQRVLGDLLGPAGGEDEELTERTVRDRYLVGVLDREHRQRARPVPRDLRPSLLGAGRPQRRLPRPRAVAGEDRDSKTSL